MLGTIPSTTAGRQPYPLATMLRIHFLQQWYALSDLGHAKVPNGKARVPAPNRSLPSGTAFH